MINKYLLEKKDFSGLEYEDMELIKQRDLRRLQVMEGYCRTTGCLRNTILNYFGEKTSLPCNNCGNCHRDYQEMDMTADAKQVINCVAETKGRYGLTIVTGTLAGADRARLRELGTVNYRSYGALKGRNEALIRNLISQLIEEGYLYQTEDRYSVLKMGNIAPLKDETTRVMMRFYEEKEPERTNYNKEKPARKKSTDSLTSAGYDLFEELRRLRLEIAREESLPPYIVFNDKTLIDMCVSLPKTPEELLGVSGVGENKLEKYGQRFLDAIASFTEAHPNAVISIQTMADDANGSTNAGTDRPKTTSAKITKSNNGKKADFYLSENDAGQFVYQDLYYISDIKNELNRICTTEGVKKISIGVIWDYLVSQELTYENNTNGVFTKMPTQKGTDYGIILEEKTTAAGLSYKLIKYPPKVQKMIVDSLIGPKAEEN